MALLNWSNEYSVEVQTIDKEHQTLFSMLNELHDAMRVGKGSQVVPTILKRLVAYTREHFVNEESLMMRARYPDFITHKGEHEKLTNEVVKIMRDLEAGEAVLSVGLLDFLRDWLQRHILGCDKKYSTCLRTAGVR